MNVFRTIKEIILPQHSVMAFRKKGLGNVEAIDRKGTIHVLYKRIPLCRHSIKCQKDGDIYQIALEDINEFESMGDRPDAKGVILKTDHGTYTSNNTLTNMQKLIKKNGGIIV